MQDKTIISTINKVHKAWLKSIKDDKVRALAQVNTICTGGAIVSMLLKEDVNDYDFYFRDLKTCQAVAEYYGKDRFEVKVEGDRVKIHIPSLGIKKSKSPKKFEPLFVTSNAISLEGKVQLIFRFYGEPSEIHRNYDFAHCTCSWDSKTKKLVTPEAALKSMMQKRLKYIGSLYPVSSIMRIRKFVQRGWTISAGEMMKIIYDAGKLDLNDPAVLEEQLVGVDVHYFEAAIEELREHDGDFTREYLFEVLDQVFDSFEESEEDE